jgi:predicted RNase H-like HicB family nuclease
MQGIKIIVEKHEDGFIAYPLGIKGGVVGEGESYEDALADARSAIRFHIDTFGPDVFEAEVLEAYVDDFQVAANVEISGRCSKTQDC